jgi:hypothetical protein
LRHRRWEQLRVTLSGGLVEFEVRDRAEALVDDDVAAVEVFDDDGVRRVIENASQKPLTLGELAHRRREPLVRFLQRVALRFLSRDVASDRRHADNPPRHRFANEEVRVEHRNARAGLPVAKARLTGPFVLRKHLGEYRLLRESTQIRRIVISDVRIFDPRFVRQLDHSPPGRVDVEWVSLGVGNADEIDRVLDQRREDVVLLRRTRQPIRRAAQPFMKKADGVADGEEERDREVVTGLGRTDCPDRWNEEPPDERGRCNGRDEAGQHPAVRRADDHGADHQ